MANTFKLIRNTDITSARTNLHEAIPITGSIVSGTYSDNNIKTYAHGMFESVYDYPYLSSSANHIFDVTVGANPAYLDSLSVTLTSQNQKKRNIYQEFGQVLVGYDVTGSIREFDVDGVLGTGSTMRSIVAVPFSRLLTKDEIKKQSFSMILGVSRSHTAPFGMQPTLLAPRLVEQQSKLAGLVLNQLAWYTIRQVLQFLTCRLSLMRVSLQRAFCLPLFHTVTMTVRREL